MGHYGVKVTPQSTSVEHTGFIGRHHVFDVDKGVLSSIALKNLQSLLDQVTDVLSLVLTVVDAISRVNWGKENTKCFRCGRG